MSFRHVLTFTAFYLPFMKFTYNERRKNKADDERRKSGKDRAERNVSEYVEKGKFVIHVGAASNDIRLSKEIVMH